MNEMLPEFGPKLSTVELGTGFSNKTSGDSEKHPSETHQTRMTANSVEEIREQIIPTVNYCRPQENSIGLGAKFVAILTRLQRQQDLILKDNSDLKSEVMQQQNTILELRKQLNTATGIHRLNFQTSISERPKPQKMTKIDQEPTAERSDQLQIEAAEVDTVTTNERSLITDCGQTDHFQDIKYEAETQSDSEEVEQLELTALSPQVDNFNQSHGSLRMKQVCSARMRESDGKRIKLNLESTEESPTNVRNSHQREKPYVCKDCGAAFSKASSLKRHQRIHSDEKPYICKDCGAAFNLAYSLKRHQRIHSVERPYVCKDCGFAVKYAGSLKEHQRSHTGERPYVCKDCGFAFKYASNLKVHQRLHKGERPYVCKDCGFAFKYASNLKVHQRLHKGEKPYICNDCGVAFSRGTTLKIHQRIHTGKKPFACDICKKLFGRKSVLSKHMDIHRG